MRREASYANLPSAGNKPEAARAMQEETGDGGTGMLAGLTFSGLMKGKSSVPIQKLNSKEKEKEGRKIILSLQRLGSGRMYGVDLMKIMLEMHNLGGNQ